jgi:hypothetical protein
MDGRKVSDIGDAGSERYRTVTHRKFWTVLQKGCAQKFGNVKYSAVASATCYNNSKLDWSNLCVEVLSFCMEYFDLDILYLKVRELVDIDVKLVLWWSGNVWCAIYPVLNSGNISFR